MSSVILASTSPWRLDLLRRAGVAARGVAPTCDESAIHHADPVTLASLRAAAKAASVRSSVPGVRDAIVIGADQVAHVDGEAFGKPRDADDHRARLRALRGRSHVLSVGVTVLHPAGELHFVEHTTVWFREDLTDALLDAYVDTREGSGCAGGYAVEGLGAQLIARIDGDWTNVIGLPLFRVIDALRAIGCRPHLSSPPPDILP